jgi:hypothetical protein
VSRHWVAILALGSLAPLIGVAAAADGTIAVRIADRLGHAEAAAFSVTDNTGAVIAGPADPGQTVAVPPGGWIVIPKLDPRLAERVTVGDGQALSVQITQPNGLWLSFWDRGDHPARWTIVEPKQPGAIAAALARFDFSRLNYTLAARRPEVLPSAAEAALALARAEYGKPATDKSASGREAWSSAQTFAARILGALGDASDVERLAQDKVLYGAYTDMIIVARIEQRLGTLDHGRVVAMADNGATDRAVAAAILLHQAGIAHGSARLIELLHATGDARYLTWRQAWAAALSLPGARVDDAFAAQLQRLQARAAAIAALPEAQGASAFNEYGSTRLPLLIHAMVAERDDQLRQLAQQPLATYEPIDLAPFVANPGALASLLMTMQRNDTDRLTAVANLCAIADLAPPSDANLVLKELADTVLADGQREAARRTDLAPAQARALPYDYLDFLTTLSGPCRPAKPIAKYFVEHNDGMLPSASWIPLDWMQDTTVGYLLGAKNNYWNPKVEAMLEGIPPDRLEALLDAKGDAAKAYPFNVYRAYHQVATRAGFLFPSYDEAGYLAAMRLDTIASRPYVFGRIEPADKDYGGGVSGVASVRLEPLDRVTRVHIRLNQSPYYHFSGFLLEPRNGDLKQWELYPYTLDRGRRLISAVKLAKGTESIAVTERGLDPDGAFVFEIGRRLDDVAGTVLELDLAYLDQTRQLLLELYDSDAMRAVQRSTLAAQTAAAAQPTELQDILALARTQAEAGFLEPAEQSYRRAAGLAPTDATVLLEAGRAFLGHDDPPRAARLLADGWAAMPASTPLLTGLAEAQFRAAAYADAAQSYAALAKTPGQEPAGRYWQGLSALLAGDLASAADAFGRAGDGYDPVQVRMFLRLAQELAAGADKSAAYADYDQYSAAQPDGYAKTLLAVFAGRSDAEAAVKIARTADDVCRAWFWGGERKAINGDAAAARDLLRSAASRCGPISPQYRLAQQALGRLPAP